MFSVEAGEVVMQFSALLNRVAAGEEITITKHGKPVARLAGIQEADSARAMEAFEKLKMLRKGTTLGGISIKELRDKGRC